MLLQQHCKTPLARHLLDSMLKCITAASQISYLSLLLLLSDDELSLLLLLLLSESEDELLLLLESELLESESDDAAAAAAACCCMISLGRFCRWQTRKRVSMQCVKRESNHRFFVKGAATAQQQRRQRQQQRRRQQQQWQHGTIPSGARACRQSGRPGQWT